MEFGHGWHGGDALASELRKLLPFGRVYVHKAIHVANAEALNAILGV